MSAPVSTAAPQEQSWTIGRLLEWTTAYFQKQGCDSPRLDAEVLLSSLLTCKRIDLYVMYETEVAPVDRQRFREMVKSRAEGCPVAYIIGMREFYSLELEVTRDVLIPRPETELVVATSIDLFRARPPFELADVCCGSGAIAVAIAHELPHAQGIAVDISGAALAVAQRNANKFGVAQRLTFEVGDLLETARAENRKFDLIVSNPPYITEAEMLNLPKTVRDFEPRLALVGGADGLGVIRRLIDQSAEVLKPGGQFLMEMGVGQEEAVHDILKETGKFELQPTVRDYAKHPRVVHAVKR